MIENGLIPFGLYGKKRATVAAALINDALKRQDIQANVKEGREKAAKAAASALPPKPADPQDPSRT